MDQQDVLGYFDVLGQNGQVRTIFVPLNALCTSDENRNSQGGMNYA
jgi:hypothetical protein